MRNMKRKIWLKVPLFILLIAAVITAVSFVTMLLWNALIPVLFSGPVITFWQAAGLLILSKILLGGFGPKRRGHHGHPGRMWRRRMQEKMHNMTPEEREKFRSKCRGYFWDEHDMENRQSTGENTAKTEN